MNEDRSREFGRRDFLKGTLAAGVVGAVGAFVGCSVETSGSSTAESVPLTAATAPTYKWAFEIPPDPIPESEITKTVETGVVIMGGGTAGLVCANAAVENGAKVVLIAASDGPVARGGSNFAINTKAMAKAGIPPIDVSKAFRLRMRDNIFRIDQDKWWTFARRSAEAMDWLNDKMVAAGYQTTFEFNFIDPEDVMDVMPGTHGWMGGDIKTMSNGQPLVVDTLNKSAQAAGVELHFSTTAVQLVRGGNNTGRVNAVVAKGGDGGYVKYAGSKAVVLATGDFTLDKDMVAKYSPWSAEIDNGGVYAGDGHKMGLWVGAAWQKTIPNAPIILSTFGVVGTMPITGMSFAGLVVNKSAQRYGNEDILVAYAGIAQARQPEMKAFGIWDSAYAENAGPWDPPGYGMPSMTAAQVTGYWDALVQASPISAFPGMPELTVFKEDTVDALCVKMGLPTEAAKATIGRYNGYCKTGVDEEYGKRSGRLHSVEVGPFYGCSGLPWRLIVSGGLRTNTTLQVLDENDEVIPGLYAVGTIVGDMFSGCYDFITPGFNLGGNCVTFGYVAGQAIAKGGGA